MTWVGTGMKILFLEDNSVCKNRINTLLPQTRFSISHCTNDNEFIDKTYRHIYDLYLIDLNVTGADGFHLLHLLQRHEDTTIKVALSWNATHTCTAYRCGCDCFLNKRNVDEITYRVTALINREFQCFSTIIRITRSLHYEFFSKRLSCNGKNIRLGLYPTLIIEYLLKHRNAYVTTNTLEEVIYPAACEHKTSPIRYHIYILRKSLGEEIITSHRALGYMIKTID